MALLKKLYSFTNKRNIWRLVPSSSGYMVIEERDMESKQVYFNCLRTNDGKVYFKNFQLDEKYWVGIEAIHNDIIFFHKFRKPDMPAHKGIYAFEISSEKVIWQNDDFIFQLAKDDMVYAFQMGFEGRNYYSLNMRTGEVIKEFGGDVNEVNNLREALMNDDFAKSFSYPEQLRDVKSDTVLEPLFKGVLENKLIVGDISWLRFRDFILFNYHLKNSDGTISNYFKLFDAAKQKFVIEETLNSDVKKLIPESFFMINDMLFLLKEKTKLVVYRIIQ